MNRKDYINIKIRQSQRYKISEYPDELYECYCNKCRNNTEHRIIVEAQKTEDIDDEGCIYLVNIYRILECAGCHYISFMEENIFSEDDELYDPAYGKKFRKCCLYPIPEEGVFNESCRSRLEYVLPNGIKQIYEETLEAVKNKLFIVAGIGLRTILDTVCREQKIGDVRSNLARRLEVMREQQLISDAEYSVLIEIKNIGNKSVHEGRSLQPHEVSEALIAVEHILDKLYLLPMINSELRNNKNSENFLEENIS